MNGETHYAARWRYYKPHPVGSGHQAQGLFPSQAQYCKEDKVWLEEITPHQPPKVLKLKPDLTLSLKITTYLYMLNMLFTRKRGEI